MVAAVHLDGPLGELPALLPGFLGRRGLGVYRIEVAARGQGVGVDYRVASGRRRDIAAVHRVEQRAEFGRRTLAQSVGIVVYVLHRRRQLHHGAQTGFPLIADFRFRGTSGRVHHQLHHAFRTVEPRHRLSCVGKLVAADSGETADESVISQAGVVKYAAHYLLRRFEILAVELAGVFFQSCIRNAALPVQGVESICDGVARHREDAAAYPCRLVRLAHGV